MIKVAIFTQGCRVNQSESSSIIESLKKNNYLIVPLNSNPDILIINSCTVTEKSDIDLRRFLNKLQIESPKTKVALTGCQAEIKKDSLFKFANVKWIIGQENKKNLIEILNNETCKTHISEIENLPFIGKYPPKNDNKTRFNVKIQDGCDCFCSYCIVPYARGRARSRDFNDAFTEINGLINEGAKEIILTGINIGKYNNEGKNLLDLLKKITNIKGDFRIRLSSIEPDNILPEIINEMSHNKKLCRFLHIPLQSGSDRILSLMERKHNVNEFKNLINFAKKLIPDICIGTDIITGFSGENDELFNETLSFLTEIPLSYFHVFSYSKRTGTKSEHFKNEIPKDIIKNRSKILRDLSNSKRKVFLNSLINKIQCVLFEDKKNNSWTGISDNYVRVFVKSNENLNNRFFNVRFNKIEGINVVGEIIK